MGYLLWSGVALLLLLILRFLQPEVIYVIRDVIIKITANKAFLDHEANRRHASKRYRASLMKTYRHEGSAFSDRFVRKRINAIRELHSILDARRIINPNLRQKRNPQVCIVELSNLLLDLGRQTVPDKSFDAPLVDANQILAIIGNNIRSSKRLPILVNEKQISDWFTEHPMTIEQIIELLSAAAFALSFRQKAVEISSGREQPIAQGVDDELIQSGITQVESQVRVMIRELYAEKRGSEERVFDRICELVGREQFERARVHLQTARTANPTSPKLDVLDPMGLDILQQLLLKDWPVFGAAFHSEVWLKDRIGSLLFVQERLNQKQTVSNTDRAWAFECTNDLIERASRRITKTAH